MVTAAEFGIGKDLPDLFAMEVYDDQADILSVSRMDEYPRQCDSDIGIIYIDGIAVIYADKFAACFGYLPVPVAPQYGIHIDGRLYITDITAGVEDHLYIQFLFRSIQS